MPRIDAGYEPAWRKSSYSQVSSCVEVAFPPNEIVMIRDSKDPHGPRLSFSAAEWRLFLNSSQTGISALELD